METKYDEICIIKITIHLKENPLIKYFYKRRRIIKCMKFNQKGIPNPIIVSIVAGKNLSMYSHILFQEQTVSRVIQMEDKCHINSISEQPFLQIQLTRIRAGAERMKRMATMEPTKSSLFGNQLVGGIFSNLKRLINNKFYINF